MSGRRRSILASALVAASLLASCAGEGLSKEEFTARADEICSEAIDELEALGLPQSEEDFQQLSKRATEINRGLVRDLRALEPPEEDVAEIELMLDRLQQATELVPDLTAASKERDFEAMEEISGRISVATAEASQIARSYGLEDCGRRAGRQP